MNGQSIKKICIYYFSGTGNAKKVASWIQTTAESEKIATDTIDISRLAKRKIDDVPQETMIGFCCPTHGFNFPPIMLHFIFRFPRAKNNKVFLVNTRAGMKMGKHFIVGLSGIALLLSSLVLALKGYRIVGLRSIDLPSNWISLHPGIKPAVVESLFTRRKNDTIRFISKLLYGGRSYSALRDIVQDIIIAPIAVLYYFVGRYAFAKSFIASKDCTHCNLCIEQCPIKAIKTVDKRCFWTHKCESCMHCMNICPHRAIETAHGFIIGLTFLVNTVILTLLYNFLISGQIPIIQKFANSTLSIKIFNTVVYLALLFLSYRIMHYLLRFGWFERLLVYTSLTKYKFWRRYKAPKQIKSLSIKSSVCSIKFKFKACDKSKPQNTRVFEDLDFEQQR